MSIQKGWPCMCVCIMLLLCMSARGFTAEVDESVSVVLSEDERAWLDAHPLIRARVGNFPPYHFWDNDPQGISVDLLDHIAAKTGFQVEYMRDMSWPDAVENIRNHENVDLLLTANRTPERETFMALSQDYLKLPWVIFTRQNENTIFALEDLFGKTVAIEEGYVMQERLAREFPKIRLRLFKDAAEALEAVSLNQADAYVGNLMVAQYHITHLGFTNLKVAAPTGLGDHTQAFAVRDDWPQLAAILDKGLAAITPEERSVINRKYFTVEVAQKVDYTRLWWALLTIGLVAGFIVLWNYSLQRQIAERKRAEGALQEAKRDAEAANQAKSTFLASMSHELRTPLNGILGYAQILKRDPLTTPKQRHGLNVIEQSGHHLLALINDVLDLAKVEAGKTDLYQTDFYMPSLLIGVGEIIKIQAERKGIDFHLESADDLPKRVFGDERRLRQVLLNVLGNAVKFTDKGSVTLRVSAPRRGAGGEVLLRFEIQDTGMGISPEHLETIFKSFEQVGEQKQQARGTGLGLAVSQKLVELMGGRLCVSSQLDVGTQFWFESALPIVDDDHRVAQVSRQLIIGIKGESPKILVVDDNLDNQAVLVDLLSPLGFIIKQAGDGSEGLETATQWLPDAIITDLIMPEPALSEVEGMDGFELIRRLRQSPILKEKVIIANSASVYEADQKKSLAIGSDAFLPKPIQAETLLDQLQQHLNLTWLYGDNIRETAEEELSRPIVLPPIAELEKLYELSLAGDIDELEKEITVLVKSDVTLQPFVAKIRTFFKEYQVDELIEWLEGEMR